jgi:hypothetical protein
MTSTPPQVIKDNQPQENTDHSVDVDSKGLRVFRPRIMQEPQYADHEHECRPVECDRTRAIALHGINGRRLAAYAGSFTHEGFEPRDITLSALQMRATRRLMDASIVKQIAYAIAPQSRHQPIWSLSTGTTRRIG